jgi:(1->4)-alpha-D-glucan 1-alpha-D-glucosylmutase
MIPRATYRVQFHAGFTFADAAKLADYWAALGVSHLYASPIAQARAGSTHGYDVVDPTSINAALGGRDGFEALASTLLARGLGIILDIVPNHLAVGGSDNAWWLDVLENGPQSRFATYFDIDWRPKDPSLRDKVLAPFLGAPYGEVLKTGGLRLDYEPEIGRLSVLAHGAHRFPLRRDHYDEVLATAQATDLASLDADRLQAAYDTEAPEGRERLHMLMERQAWRLAWWRTAGDAINWRRFFDITELAGMRVEEPEVFDALHALPLELYEQGLVSGLRVDHIDGLADPGAYCRRLRAALQAREARRPDELRGAAYLVVEKILGPGERLAADWQVDGATGYEFMNEMSALLHAPEAEAPLANAWTQATGRPAEFEPEEISARAEILGSSFAGQLDAAAQAFHRLGQERLETRDVAPPAYRRAIAALIDALRIYRTYGARPAPNLALQAAIEAAKASNRIDGPVLSLLGEWLTGDRPGDLALRAEAIRRFEQLSAPVAAKAVEDTAFYRYGRLISRNDVGFDPGRLSTSPAAFLALCQERAAAFPHAMLTTATHDHKRGEDVRARLSVISEAPDRWLAEAADWIDAGRREGVASEDVLMLLQTLVGAWPLDLDQADRPALNAFGERVAAWQVKALREAKLRSDWAEPNEDYERICARFLQSAFAAADDRMDRLARFVRLLAPAGVAKSLVQTGLRLTLPGTPDLYQGCEGWDFSLVDPDNRRPVDYAQRAASLGRAPPADWRDPAIKQSLIARLLAWRARAPKLFAGGELQPLELRGERAGETIAFARAGDGLRLVVVAALRTWSACAERGQPDLPEDWWGDTTLGLDPGGPLPLSSFAGTQTFAAKLTAA